MQVSCIPEALPKNIIFCTPKVHFLIKRGFTLLDMCRKALRVERTTARHESIDAVAIMGLAGQMQTLKRRGDFNSWFLGTMSVESDNFTKSSSSANSPERRIP